jgi:hypothetical protein
MKKITFILGCYFAISSIGVAQTISNTTPASRCDTGSVTINATSNTGYVNWYASPTSDTVISQDTSYTTGILLNTTPFYASAANRLMSISDAGQNNAAGLMFDLQILNNITLTNFSYVPNGPSFNYNIYYRTGTYVGHESSNTGWTLLSTGAMSSTTDLITPIVFSHPFNVNLAASQTYGFYIAPSDPIALVTDPSPHGTINGNDANLKFISGDQLSAPSEFGGIVFSDYIFAGQAIYEVPASRTSVVATINQLPTVTANATSAAVCEGSSVTLTGGGTATSYNWTDGITDGVSFIALTPNTYTVTGTDANNCTDTASISIDINPMPIVTTTVDSITITANQSGATYQWINCSDSSIIVGATSANYTATVTGNYSVIVTLNTCVDTAVCVNVSVSTLGIDNISSHAYFVVYPNPSNGVFTVKSLHEGEFSIVNELGQTIQLFKLDVSNNYTAHIENLNKGVYFITGYNSNLTAQQKIVVLK